MDSSVEVVYSTDRARRLRIVSWIVAVLAALLAVFSIALAVGGDGDKRATGIFSLCVAAVLLGVSVLAIRLLPGRDRPAKRSAVAAGIVSLLAGLMLAGTWLSFVLPLVALGLLFLALLPDENADDEPLGGAST